MFDQANGDSPDHIADSDDAVDSLSTQTVNSSSRMSAELSTTRREFLLLAGVTTAGASLLPPSTLLAELTEEQGGVSPQSILVPANGHAAIQAAARILAKKLKLDESAISTYEGAPKAAAGAIVLALASAGKLPADDVPKQDGYTVLYAGGTVVYGARPRSLLFAMGEPTSRRVSTCLPI